MKVLIIDDEEDLSEMLVEYLKSEGVEAVATIDLLEARSLSEGCTHALLDSYYGKSYDLALFLKSRGIKTFLFTGDPTVVEISKFYDGLIRKPFDIDEIIKILKGP